MSDIDVEMDECVQNFNGLLKPLVLRIEEKYSENGSIYRLRKRLFLALSNDDTLAMVHLGPSLWKQKKPIMERNEEHFLNFDYESEFMDKKDDNKLGDKPDDESVSRQEKNILVDFIDVIKRDYPSLSQDEKDSIYETIKQLLIEYAKYVKLEKRKKEM